MEKGRDFEESDAGGGERFKVSGLGRIREGGVSDEGECRVTRLDAETGQVVTYSSCCSDDQDSALLLCLLHFL